MTTKTKIYNGAFGKIGVERITSLSDDSPQRIRADDQYDTALEATLEAFAWPFATKRVELAQDSETPPFGWDYQYPIPADCVRITEVWDGASNDSDNISWKEEDGFVKTDLEEFYIVYTYLVEDESKYSSMFAEAFEFKLGALLAMPLKGSRVLMMEMLDAFTAVVNKAETQNAKKRSRRSMKQKSTWLTARTTPVPSFVNVIKVT